MKKYESCFVCFVYFTQKRVNAEVSLFVCRHTKLCINTNNMDCLAAHRKLVTFDSHWFSFLCSLQCRSQVK